MKKVSMIAMLGFLMVGVSSARAEYSLPLGAIDLDASQCAQVQADISLLSNDQIKVDAACSFGSFVSLNGNTYSAQINTSITVHDEGIEQLQLGGVDLDWSQCAQVQADFSLLSTDQVKVDAACSYGSFFSLNGNTYNGQINTSIMIHRN